MGNSEREKFEAWSASVKDVGHEVHPNSATARQRWLGWQARASISSAPLERVTVEEVASTICKRLNDEIEAVAITQALKAAHPHLFKE